MILLTKLFSLSKPDAATLAKREMLGELVDSYSTDYVLFFEELGGNLVAVTSGGMVSVRDEASDVGKLLKQTYELILRHSIK